MGANIMLKFIESGFKFFNSVVDNLIIDVVKFSISAADYCFMLLAVPMGGVNFNACSKFSLFVLYSNNQINIGRYVGFWLSKIKGSLDVFNKELFVLHNGSFFWFFVLVV